MYSCDWNKVGNSRLTLHVICSPGYILSTWVPIWFFFTHQPLFSRILVLRALPPNLLLIQPIAPLRSSSGIRLASQRPWKASIMEPFSDHR